MAKISKKSNFTAKIAYFGKKYQTVIKRQKWQKITLKSVINRQNIEKYLKNGAKCVIKCQNSKKITVKPVIKCQN